MEQRGYILIADITGYTAYLNESELEHAQGTLTDLLELLIAHTNQPLIISRLEGDAVISYGFEDGFLNSQTFIEMIETTYLDFRKAIELMVLNNTCQCNACANVSALDLKFFVHFGSFALQQIGAHDELLGTDVNLIHRLLKNSVPEDTGVRAYLLCTDAAVEALGIDPAAESMIRHTEAVADLGDASMWVKDMQPVYEAFASHHRIVFEPSEILDTSSVDIMLPQPVLWDYMNEPAFRSILYGSDRQEVTERKGGRTSVGSAYQCYHGDRTVTQAVVEWEPFDRVVIEQPAPIGVPMSVDYELAPIDGGTRMTVTAALPDVKGLKRTIFGLVSRLYAPTIRKRLDQFRDVVEDNSAQRGDKPSSQIDLDSIADTAAEAVAGWNALTR